MVSAFPPGGARAVARCDELGVAPYSDMRGGLYRGYLSPAYDATLERLGEWMAEAGLSVRRDPAANLVGRYEGAQADAPALIIGSHIDSVRDGGRYDGPLGITLGIECVDALRREGRRLPFAIEIYGFGDEEGSRFPAAMLTSRAVAGLLEPAALEIADGSGVALADAGVDVATYLEAGRAKREMLAYLEAHIEQGPVLERAGEALGVVSAICGIERHSIGIAGETGHAGTLPMEGRKDALVAASAIVTEVNRLALETEGLRGTVGAMTIGPNRSEERRVGKEC